MKTFVRGARLGAVVILVCVAASCDDTAIFDPPVQPALDPLDAQLRLHIGAWGPVPIGDVPAQNPVLVDLGRSLFFDRILSGNRDVSCASCHDPDAGLADRQRLAVGTGAVGSGAARAPGAGREFVPRNAMSLLNTGAGHFYSLWDGRLNEEMGAGRFRAPEGVVLPSGLANLLAAQAMLPVLNRQEMRGTAGDRDVFGAANELAAFTDQQVPQVWSALMSRVLGIQEYAARFAAAFPGTPTSQLGFQHAANAIAAFQISAFTRTNTPFDRYLARDNAALTDEQKRGGILFFGKAACATCHFGPLLGGSSFANIGVPQFGPGVGAAAPLDAGRGEQFRQIEFYQFSFRVPSLRNVELTAPYMHNGAYESLDQVLRHYTNADSALRNYDPSRLPPALRSQYRGDPASINAILKTLDSRVRMPIRLNAIERTELLAFLHALTDPSARTLAHVTPERVPSGLPVRD